MFHVIDTIVADDILENAKSQEGLVEVRAKINQIHGRISGNDSVDKSGISANKQRPPQYVTPDDNGMIPGLREGPLG